MICYGFNFTSFVLLLALIFKKFQNVGYLVLIAPMLTHLHFMQGKDLWLLNSQIVFSLIETSSGWTPRSKQIRVVYLHPSL